MVYQTQVKVKVQCKAIQLQARTSPEGSHISRQSAHEGSKVVSPKHRPSLPPGNIHGTRFF
jgi:hypothetical protein